MGIRLRDSVKTMIWTSYGQQIEFWSPQELFLNKIPCNCNFSFSCSRITQSSCKASFMILDLLGTGVEQISTANLTPILSKIT